MVRKEVKRKIIAGLDKKDLVLIQLTRSEKKSKLRWKHSKEFEYKGQMYDIVEKEYKNGITYYWCWWDFEETRLNKKLKQLAAHAFNHSDRKHQQEKKISNFFQSLFFEDTRIDAVFVEFKETREYYTSKSEFLLNSTNSPPSPPPKSC